MSTDAPKTPPQDAEPAMSDDEARRLLAEMDAPLIPELTEEEPPVAAPIPVSNPSSSAQSLPPEEPAQPALHEHSASATADENDDLAEVSEFSQNEFASDPEMLSDFGQNSAELMESLDQNILALEQNPGDRETIEAIFRAAHTLKGAAGMFGFLAIERVMHRMENLFDLIRKGELIPTPDIVDVVFRGLDTLKTLLGAVNAQKASGIKTAPIVRALDLAITGIHAPVGLETEATAAPSHSVPKPLVDSPTLPTPQPVPPLQPTMTSPKLSPEQASPSASKATLRRDESTEKNDANALAADRSQTDGSAKKSDQSTIRVDLDRLDMLVNLVGELVIDRTRFAAIENEIRASAPQLKAASVLSETVQLFGRHMNEIHEIIMKIRMVPIGNAFNKFNRVVRDLARQLGKEIQLDISGEDTELDKTLVEQIGDPLIHLIRNSCDHGVELPADRVKSGKNPTGTIRLAAKQEGHHVIITITDDGKGIPVDAVRRKGIERGLIKEHDNLAPRDIFNLIFEPGFSTAEKITNVSGRGVGMDVVRKQIGKLKGIIEIDSEQGKGTKISIRLPLTLAIVQSLLVKSTESTFALPLSSVIESVRIKPEDVQNIGDSEVIKRHDKVLPLMHLTEVLDMSAKTTSCWYGQKAQSNAGKTPLEKHLGPSRQGTISSHGEDPNTSLPIDQKLFVVIVGAGEKRFGIVVDQLLHQQEMVIKSMGPLMTTVPCIAGGAVLGNGEVVLVLDIPELEERFRLRGSSHLAASA